MLTNTSFQNGLLEKQSLDVTDQLKQTSRGVLDVSNRHIGSHPETP